MHITRFFADPGTFYRKLSGVGPFVRGGHIRVETHRLSSDEQFNEVRPMPPERSCASSSRTRRGRAGQPLLVIECLRPWPVESADCSSPIEARSPFG